MNSNIYTITTLRILLFVALQVLVFSRIGLGETWASYFQPMLYPLVILLLPVGIPSSVLLLLAFFVGTLIDIPLGTYGIHAGALVLTTFCRQLVLNLIAPRDGYNVGQLPTRKELGFRWFLAYSGILMIIHTFTFYSIQVFTFVFLNKIVLQTLGSLSISMTLIVLFALLFTPAR